MLETVFATLILLALVLPLPLTDDDRDDHDGLEAGPPWCW